jgi:hypothetical protein
MPLALGLVGLLIESYALAGRPATTDYLRGIGPLSLAVIAVGAGLFFFSAGQIRRRMVGRSRAATGLFVAIIAIAIAAATIILRHPLSGHAVFRHDPTEVTVTRTLLWCVACLFVVLWQWQGTIDAIEQYRANGGTRWMPIAVFRARTAPLREPLANLALLLTAVMVGGVLCEAATRLIAGAPLLSGRNLVSDRVSLLKLHTANNYDPVLGWVLADNQQVDANGSFTTGRYGVRMNGPDIVPVPEHAVLAVGDSFTAGSEVRNAESWPAQLEAKLGEPVVNAATGGWGTDQIVLRAESLIPIVHPSRIIVSFLVDDIDRAAYRTYSGGNKPFFTIRDGELEAHNVPVPPFDGRARELGWLRSLLGHSYLAALALQRVGLYEWWFSPPYSRVEVDTTEIACLLLKRLKAQTDAAHIPFYFLLQYQAEHIAAFPDEPTEGRRVLACAGEAGIHTIDTWQPLLAVSRRDRQVLRSLYVIDNGDFGHMSAAGNGFIAGLLTDAIRPSKAHDGIGPSQ